MSPQQQQKVEAPKYNYPTGGYEDRNVPPQQPQQGGRNPYLEYEQPPQPQQGGRNPYLDYEQPPQQEEFIAKNYQRTQNFENPQQEPQMLLKQLI